MNSETTKITHDPYGSLRIPEFRLFIAFRLLLTIAIQMQGVIVGWQVYNITKDALSLGFIGLAEAIPFMLVSLYAGHVADTVSRKKIILFSVTLFFICAIALLFFTVYSKDFISRFGTIPIYYIIAMTGIARGFAGPAISAFWSQLVPRDLYANASGWSTTAWQIGAVSGPAIGGLLFGFLGDANAYAIDAGLIVASLVCVSFIAKKPVHIKEKKESLKTSLSAGIRFVFNNQIILGALSLDLFAVLFGGAVALLPIFAAEILKVGPEGLGLLKAAPSMGAVLMALYLTHRPPMKKAGRNLLYAVAGFGLCMIVFALSKNFYFSFFILALSGAFDNVSVVVRTTIIQLLTPDEMRGRVSSVNSIFIGSSNEIGEFESGVTARFLGLIPSVVFGGLMTLGVVGFTAKKARKLRKLDLSEI
jgi:MFS family permease